MTTTTATMTTAPTECENIPRSSRRRSPVMVSTWEEMNPSRRCSMEDCSIYKAAGTWDAPDNNMAYLGVYDGHGGRDMVEYLEHGLTYHVAQELQCKDDASMATRLERAFMIADVHSRQLGVVTSGATVAICLVQKPKDSNTLKLYAANAGDARIVLGHEGRATRLTKDHRTDDPEEVERIEKAGGFMFKGRVLGVLAVTRSLGDHCMKSYVISKPNYQEVNITLPTMKERKCSPSFLILACDGLWDVFEDQDAVNFVLKYQESRAEISEYLINEALQRGSTDNITVVVAWL